MRPSILFAALSLGALSALASAGVAGCATYQDDLARGESAFEASEHERALAIFRALEPDVSRLSDADRTHYAYLRGMTDFRVGYKSEARHWLSIAAALEQQTPGSLPPEWTKRMNGALQGLNEAVYASGVTSLTNTMEARATPSDEPASNDGDTSPDAPPAKTKPPTRDDH